LTRKKGVPRYKEGSPEAQRLQAIVDHILAQSPPTNAVQRPTTPEQRIRALETQLLAYQRQVADIQGFETEISEGIREMRHALLRTCKEILPIADKSARQGKPALLRLISRIVKGVR
jgi:hypothetical protein